MIQGILSGAIQDVPVPDRRRHPKHTLYAGARHLTTSHEYSFAEIATTEPRS